MKLREMQERFLLAISGRAGAAENLAGFDPARLVRGDRRLDAVGRLDIYADMYFLRLRDVIADDYPRLAATLGAEAFHALMQDYLASHPPTAPEIRDVGAQLPAFLQGRGPPAIVDLARLEWARADLFDRADDETLTLDHLRALPPDAFAALPLALIRAAVIVEVLTSVETLWRGEGQPDAAPGRLLVWRRDLEVRHRRLTAPEEEVFALVQAGTSFGAVCEALAAHRTPEETAPVAFQLLAGWAETGVLVAA